MRGLSLPFLGILGAVEAFISDNADSPAFCQQPKQNKQRTQSVSTLELAVYQATQYKFAIFFKNENRSETTLGVLILFVGSLMQQKIASAREAFAMRGRQAKLGTRTSALFSSHLVCECRFVDNSVSRPE
jgi:hypothetical protein